MSNQEQALKFGRKGESEKVRMSPRTGGRGSEHRNERRDKGIRIRSSTHDRLTKRVIHPMRDDFDDIISRLLDRIEELERKERQQKK